MNKHPGCVARPPESGLFIGLMSGTSLDGVDAALVDFRTTGPQRIATHYLEFNDGLRAELMVLQAPGPAELDRAAAAAVELARAYAASVLAVLGKSNTPADAVAAIGCHGQTVRHRPESGFSIQLNNPSLLAEQTGITVVADFRSRDIAAGGQGAPLVPAFHAACFGHASAPRAVLNIGGIANITYLPSGAAGGEVFGFDTGPGNVLLDMWSEQYTEARYDRGGGFAGSGTLDAALLQAFLADPYFGSPPPKSTGRDHFNRSWLDRHERLSKIRPEDVQATLSELSAQSIAAALIRHCPDIAEVYVCGGGIHNADLMARLGKALGAMRVESTEVLGIHPDWVEAMAFAWLARRTLFGEPGNLPQVTGARGSRILGGIFPA